MKLLMLPLCALVTLLGISQAAIAQHDQPPDPPDPVGVDWLPGTWLPQYKLIDDSVATIFPNQQHDYIIKLNPDFSGAAIDKEQSEALKWEIIPPRELRLTRIKKPENSRARLRTAHYYFLSRDKLVLEYGSDSKMLLLRELAE